MGHDTRCAGAISPISASVPAASGPVDVAAALLAAEAAGDVTVMSPDYQRITALFATSGSAWRCRDVCVELGLETEARHVEGMRSKLKRLVERGILAESAFQRLDRQNPYWICTHLGLYRTAVWPALGRGPPSFGPFRWLFM